jgi:UMF1 family MFS transporter
MQTASKKVINGWAMYDWANSVYNLVITTTFFPIYFIAVTKNGESDKVQFLGREFVNSSLYDYTLATAYLLIAFSYPILTSIADTRGNKKNFMKFFCYMGAIGCSSLFFFDSTNLWLGIIGFMLAAMGFVGSLVFYNAYLPEIAAPEDRDRISAKGFSFGYIGSVLMQLIGFALVTLMADKGLATRITFLIVGIWWISFAQISFARLPESVASAGKKTGNMFAVGFAELGKVWNQLKKLNVLKTYLLSFFFYSMGVQTVMLAATLFGSKVLKLPDTNLIVTVVIIQVVAIAGAIVMARLSNTFGNIKVLMATVSLWILICIGAYIVAGMAEKGVNAEYYFYGLAVAVGLVMGGIQSLSRSTYSKLMPETKDTSSFFSFYDVTEKVAIVIGMLSFGFIDERLGMKNSVLSLIVFFFLGLITLAVTLRKQQSQRTLL